MQRDGNVVLENILSGNKHSLKSAHLDFINPNLNLSFPERCLFVPGATNLFGLQAAL